MTDSARNGIGSADGMQGARTHSPFLALFALDRIDEHFPGRLISCDAAFYWLRVSDFLREGRRLVLVDGPFRFEVEVAICYPEEQTGYRLGCRIVSRQPGTVRQEWRMTVDIPAQLTVTSTGQVHKGRIRDSSPFGFGVELPVELPPGTAVNIRTPDGVGSGEVRHSRALDPPGSFFAGLHICEYEPAPEPAAERALRMARRLARRFYVNTLGFASRT